MTELTSKPWLIMPSWLQAINNIATGKDLLSDISHPYVLEQLTQRKEALSNGTSFYRKDERLTEQRGSIGILKLTGPIIRYGGLMEISGYTSLDRASQEFKKLEEDASVKTIVLVADGPGGQAAGIDQFANMISNSSKKTIAYVDDLAASAHYWIVSACNEIVASPTSFVGSIGVVYALLDDSKKKKTQGLKNIEIVSSVSPKKRPDITSEEGQAQIQKWADALGEKFVQAVATNRSTSVETVKDKFGKGDLLISDEAIKVGMIDKIQDFEELMSDLSTNSTLSSANFNEGENMTAKELQAQYPDAYNEIYTAGATSERERIQAIEEAIPLGYENVEALTKLKFDGASDAVAVKAALFDYNEEQKAKTSESIRSDATSLASQVEAIDDSSLEAESKTKDDEASKSMDLAIKKLNEGR